MIATPTSAACIEIGGSGAQTVRFDGEDVRIIAGIAVDGAEQLALAVPGLVRDGRIVGASTFGWYDVDPVRQLALPRPPDVVCNDAEAAALGEWVLGGQPAGGLLYVGLGTGVGGAAVRVVAGRPTTASNLFGHSGDFSDATCVCGRTGCLETVAAGWALPTPLDAAALPGIAAALTSAIESEREAAGIERVVVTGGMVDSAPALAQLLTAALPARRITASSRPAPAKSAAAWGLRALLADQAGATPSAGSTGEPPAAADA